MKKYKSINILINNIKIIDYFSNTYITYKIVLTIWVLITLTIKNFSSLRLTIFQKNVILLSIEKKKLNKINYNNLINILYEKIQKKIINNISSF